MFVVKGQVFFWPRTSVFSLGQVFLGLGQVFLGLGQVLLG